MTPLELEALRFQEARLLRTRGVLDEAEALLCQILEHRQSLMGHQNHQVAMVEMELGDLLVERQRAKEAQQYIADAGRTFARIFPATHEYHQVIKSIEGKALFILGNRHDGLALMRSAARNLADMLGKQHFLARQAQKRLSNLNVTDTRPF